MTLSCQLPKKTWEQIGMITQDNVIGVQMDSIAAPGIWGRKPRNVTKYKGFFKAEEYKLWLLTLMIPLLFEHLPKRILKPSRHARNNNLVAKLISAIQCLHFKYDIKTEELDRIEKSFQNWMRFFEKTFYSRKHANVYR